MMGCFFDRLCMGVRDSANSSEGMMGRLRRSRSSESKVLRSGSERKRAILLQTRRAVFSFLSSRAARSSEKIIERELFVSVVK